MIIEEGGKGFCNARSFAKVARGEERKMAEERVTTVGDRLEACAGAAAKEKCTRSPLKAKSHFPCQRRALHGIHFRPFAKQSLS